MSVQLETELPPTFRQNSVNAVFQHIAAGDSCMIIGIGSVGKSNLLRFLQRQDVVQTYLGDNWSQYVLVYIDTNKLLKESFWGLSELMMFRLIREIKELPGQDEALANLNDLYEKATARKTKFLHLRYLEQMIEFVCRGLNKRLVFLFDEFDPLVEKMSPQSFNALRALRDEFKYQLMYVVAARFNLKRLRVNSAEIEAFEEIVTSHTVWVGPYSKSDAHYMVHRLGKRYGIELDKNIQLKLLDATGGHPGLLREGFNCVMRGDEAVAVKSLFGSLQVQDECQRLWFSLSAEEQRVITDIARNRPVEESTISIVNRLHDKGVLGGPWAGDQKIFSPLLAEYISQKQPVAGARMVVETDRRIVWVDGRKISDFTRLEFELLTYLYRQKGQVVSRDELINTLYSDQLIAGVSDNRLDSVVKRVRKKIEPNPREPQFLQTERGVGFCLLDPGDETP